MRKLLQKLEDLGWKPYGKSIAELTETEKNVRLFTSSSSGLWQFVCENGMYKKDQYTNTTRIQEYEDERDSETYGTKYDEGSYLFRLIESSLKDESELEDFLLSNIKVDE